MVEPVVAQPSLRLAGTCLLASAVVGTVSLVALGGMFAAFASGAKQTGLTLGFVNDILALPTLLLAVPAILELRRLLRPTAPLTCDVVTALALLATIGVCILQGLLVLGLVPFEQEVGPVMVVYLGLMAWYIAIGVIGNRAGLLPRGGRMGVLGASYVGYPVWAVWMGRRLRALAAGTVPAAGGAAVRA